MKCSYNKYCFNYEQKDNNQIGLVLDDSGSDSCLLSHHWLIVEYTNTQVTLLGCQKEFQKSNIKIGHGVATYQVDADTRVLIGIKHAIIGSGEQSTILLCPNNL